MKLFNRFKDRNVHIITKTKVSEEIDTGDGVTLVHAPIGEEGIALDIDEDFIYLGTSDKVITTAVSRKDISTMKIVELVEKTNVVKLAPKEKPEKPDGGTLH